MDIMIDKKDRDKLVHDNMKLVLYIINTKTEINDDIISYGMMGLIKAANTYDINKNVKFTTWAATCIWRECLTYFRTRKRKYSLDEPLDNDNSLKCVDSTGIIALQDALDRYCKITPDMKSFDINKRNALKLSSYNKSQLEIAKTLNKTQSYISLVLKQARKEFNECINPQD